MRPRPPPGNGGRFTSRTQKTVAVAGLVLLVLLAVVAVWHETRLRDLERLFGEPIVKVSDIRDVRPDPDPDVSRAPERMRNFAMAIDAYVARNARLPTTLAELTEADPRTGEPYIESIPDDPWGNPYEYRVPGYRDHQIVSGGPDGFAGDEDDVVWP